ncbi:MAG: CapA family protein [Ardenticatenaceae bacterium]|nr:CapA family protein [Ardenticatenaceae bacterium]
MPTVTPPLLPSPSAPLPTITPSPPHLVTPSPLHLVTPSPLPPTPIPLILAVPPQWDAALDALPPLWQTLAMADPAVALANGKANAALLHDNSGYLIQQTALALTVPFTLDWHDITLAQAQEIMANGHADVIVLPWDEMTPERRPLRIDGRSPSAPDYPLQNSWSLAAAPQTDISELAAALQTPATAVVQITAVGDLMLDRSLGWYIAQGDLAYPFADIANLLSAADLTIGNLECALGDTSTPAAKSYPFRAPPEAAQALALAGFDIVNLANNHAMDYGTEALQQGLSLLSAAGVAAIGAGDNAQQAHEAHIETVNGLTLAFLGYVNVPVEAISGFDTASWTATADSPGLAWADPEQIRADVTAVAPQVDLVIVTLHSGYEYVDTPSPPQIAAAHAAIDAGAAVVLGHHAHILQGIEFYGDGVIVYGLGNFAFEIDGPSETAVLNLWLDADGVRELELVPAVIQFGGQPRPAEAWEAGPIRQRVYYLSSVLTVKRDE